MTFPGAIAAGYFYVPLVQTELGYLLMVFCDSITFSYHSLNFFLLFLTNPKFRSELKHLLPIIFRLASRNETNSYTNTQTNKSVNSQSTCATKIATPNNKTINTKRY